MYDDQPAQRASAKGRPAEPGPRSSCADPRRYTAAQADESTRVVSAWVREEKLEKALPNPPKITAGEVVVHKTRELVSA
jgi:hypothetical protein